MARYTLVLFLSIVLVNQVCETNGARILGIFPLAVQSHYILGHKLMKELALRGHEVTAITAYGQKTTMNNYKDIVLKGLKEEMEVFKGNNLISVNSKSAFGAFNVLLKLTAIAAERTLESVETKNLLNSGEKFDLVIMEAFLIEAHVAFAHKFDAPLVVLSTVGSNFLVNEYVKNPAPVSYCSQVLMGITGKMSFTQRLMNTALTIFGETMMHIFHLPAQNSLVQKHFPGAPPIQDIINERLSLVLVNSHPSINQALPTVPNMIEIGGYHVEEPKELPMDLKEYLDGAKEGFILFSMGSNLKSTMLPEEKRNVLLTVFKNLPYKILWKFENENLPGKPDNVRIGKWLPQNDILAHPNLKLFITHGGLLSTTEAVYNAVPIVGIPVFFDQKMNMETARTLGIGEKVEFANLNYNALWKAVNEVLHNKKYRENVRERSILLRDQPMKPIDSAMYWIEYSLRHKTSNHLKTSAIHLTWWELRNLDVIAFSGTIIFVSVYTFYWIIKKLCCSKRKTNKQQEKKLN